LEEKIFARKSIQYQLYGLNTSELSMLYSKVKILIIFKRQCFDVWQ